MYALTANEAKTQFGDLLLKAQREPVQINRNGKPVAVVMSVENYQALEDLKLRALQQKIAQATAEEDAGKAVDGDAFFNRLLTDETD
ncbi:type II toxin-antitoxin system Phd/YefM family antitoxin [Serratia marcescens]|uniref:type II toxin-antitoxin system Phd/YefM family antitoxin n=1 Tax=Serratia marcescens TaxID=615 RepID=UPI0007450E0D|nr:type II toxin-antitoxin system Phd/YefM family antitoxin [Serratia marcescens]CUY37209.1 prevent-host-death family protein [Serratia marcescens]HAT3745438.1 type II toxin-antitoxin system Phd/YefM family antitoxin [Serratia marcescens]HAT3784416.1 type II toxin-antitoxin system Phd/YefM family antitoxin [Serratia marcescens]HAT3787738.1 type II toxin-antitoxin system Phd/YefM family antitoxin [Serratia marcescens]HAT3798898.1 type II toxin-antitoxin system Phd/YefM family antitoxin [Serrati